jgi:hypothetical protein
MDYNQATNALIVSVGSGTRSFVRLFTNNVGTNIVTWVSNWSGISITSDEVKLTTVKPSTPGVTNGVVYYGSGVNVGWLSADGTKSNLNWGVLKSATQTNTEVLRGGVYVDQTGTFSNHVIAVTSPGTITTVSKQIWRVSPQGVSTFITNINTLHLEGVITLTNDVAKWGPWAGKIITGDPDNGKIYAIDTNGVVTTYDTASFIGGQIAPEDFDLVPTNQSFYICDQFNNKVVKLAANYMTNFVGSLLITQGGEGSVGTDVGKLFFVRWNSGITNFEATGVTYRLPNGTVGKLEHGAFAPLVLPNL